MDTQMTEGGRHGIPVSSAVLGHIVTPKTPVENVNRVMQGRHPQPVVHVATLVRVVSSVMNRALNVRIVRLDHGLLQASRDVQRAQRERQLLEDLLVMKPNAMIAPPGNRVLLKNT
jgi:hypothetical protein